MIRQEVRNKDIGWKPHSTNMVKMNTNEASKDHNMVEFGGIIRDTMGSG